MMSNNKILTVSYGTFSCTLEGFDDSFGTMKVIAEYFRDLAADDRYFGAEPPQPDAEMLARIAQKEVSRKVEAREQDGKIVLSALEDGTKQTPQTAPAATQAVAVAAVAAAADSIEDAVEVADTAPEPIEIEPLSEIDTTPVEVLDTDLVPDDDEEDDDAILASLKLKTEPEFVEDENDIVPGQPDDDVRAFFAENPEVEEADDAEIEDIAAPAEDIVDAPASDSIAAKLHRIRAVVAQQQEAEETDDYLEDEHAEADTPVAADAEADDSVEISETPAKDLIAEARADIEEALDIDEATDEQAVASNDDDDEVNAILSRLEGLNNEPAATKEVESAPIIDKIEAEVESAETSVEDTVSNLFDEDEGTLDAITKELEASEEKPVAPKVSLRRNPKVTPSEGLDVTTQDAQEDTNAPRRPRVIKVKRADLEAAIEKGDLEEYGDEDKPDAPVEAKQPRKLDDLAPAKSKSTALSPEDQDDLARELTELEGDISKLEEAPAPRRVSRRPDASSREALPSIDADSETDVSRLLAETDHQMDEPESATRRDAFAHLRAAVAAKKADAAMGDASDTEGSDGAYRDDLAEVVRPRRPVSGASRSERPSDARPAPLKLVAEQRIDVERPANAGPVRPRRVSAETASDEAENATDGESFTDFAAEMGASTMPQLLEAAAAYMSFVEGRAQFSRPQLMTKVRQAGGEEAFSREEGLRSFGQLLRTGKIEKIKGGRFTVSDDIGYRPDERAAG